MFFCDQVRDQVNTRRCPGKLPGNCQGVSRSAKIECKSQVKILNVKKLNAIFSWWQNWMQNWMLDLCRTHVDLSMYHLLHCGSTPVLYELGFTRCRKLNVILGFQFECLSWVAYLRLPLPEPLRLLDLANLKSCVQFAVGLFSKPH